MQRRKYTIEFSKKLKPYKIVYIEDFIMKSNNISKLVEHLLE